ncbi:MAG: phosphoglycerate mutase family protein [Chloroflexi bacterium]|nr:phosphoglycerate mutase family protein [Chloroflexota bacterium]
MRVLLIRHGETDWNAVQRYQGHGLVPLNARGRAQARALARRLAAGPPLTALVSSDLPRAAETADIVGAALGLVPQRHAGLREIDVGAWAGLTPAEVRQRFPEHRAAYDRDPVHTARLGGESYAQVLQRSVAALAEIAAVADGTVALVSHGGTIRVVLCHVLGLDLAQINRLWIDNCAICEVRRRRGAWSVVRINDAAHLEGEALADGA